jgi:hypothetical protein
MQKKAILFGLSAGLLFGIATPISKLLLASLSGYTVARLLYFGAALVFLPYMLRNYNTDFRPELIRNNGLKRSVAGQGRRRVRPSSRGRDEAPAVSIVESSGLYRRGAGRTEGVRSRQGRPTAGLMFVIRGFGL